MITARIEILGLMQVESSYLSQAGQAITHKSNNADLQKTSEQ
jgi:hypothetical protein